MVFSLFHSQEHKDGLVVDVLRCEGDIDVYTSPRLKEKAEVLLADPGMQIIEVDLRGVRYLDSTGLATLINIQKQVLLLTDRANVFRIRIGVDNPKIRKIFMITGLKKIFLLDSGVTGRFPGETTA